MTPVKTRISTGHTLIQGLVARFDTVTKQSIIYRTRILPRLARAFVAILRSVAERTVVTSGRGGRFLINPICTVVVQSVAHLLRPWINCWIRVITVISTAFHSLITI